LSLPFPTIPRLEEKIRTLEAEVDKKHDTDSLFRALVNYGDRDQRIIDRLHAEIAARVNAHAEECNKHIKDTTEHLVSKAEVDDKMKAVQGDYYTRTEMDIILQNAKDAYERVKNANYGNLEGKINAHKTTMEQKFSNVEQEFNVHDKEVCQSVENVWKVLDDKMNKSDMYSKDDIHRYFCTKNEAANSKTAMLTELESTIQSERKITNKTIDDKNKDMCTKVELRDQLSKKAEYDELTQIKKHLDQKAWSWEGYTIDQINTRFGNRVKKDDVYTKQNIDDMLSQKAGTEDVQNMLKKAAEDALRNELSKKADLEKVYTKQDVDERLQVKADVPYYLHQFQTIFPITSINVNFAFDYAVEGKTLQEKVLLEPANLRMVNANSKAALDRLKLETIKKCGTWEYFLMAQAIDEVVEMKMCEPHIWGVVPNSCEDFKKMLGLKPKELMPDFADVEFEGLQLGTIELLGTWNLAECASAIVTLAELEADSSTEVDSPFFKRARTLSRTPKNILLEPLSALRLSSHVNLEKFEEKLGIKTIGELGRWKHYKLARAIWQLAKHNIPNNASELQRVRNDKPSSLNDYTVPPHPLDSDLEELGISTVKDLGKWKLAKNAKAMSTLAEHVIQQYDTTQPVLDYLLGSPMANPMA